MLRKNRTIDWQKKESARAGMRRLVKRLLKKYKYPPEESENAKEVVLKQCEEWTDNTSETSNSLIGERKPYSISSNSDFLQQVAEPATKYERDK